MRITGGLTYKNGAFSSEDVFIEGDRIVEANTAADDAVIDATDCYVIPGLVDLHFHGSAGADFCDATPEAYNTIARYEASRGVTSICPATMTYSEEILMPIMKTAASWTAPEDGSSLVGINMEGPYISPSKVGAQNPAYVRSASVEEFTRLQEASGGLIKLVDIAPEEPGNLDFIKEMAGKVRISLAHMCADYDQARAAFEAGARHMTHLYNAMPSLHHRNPGPIAAGAERDDITAEIIADNVHIHPSMVRLAFNMFGAHRMILISDTLRAAGLEDGTYDLGGQDVTVRGKVATIDNGALAGSVTDLMGCFVTAVTEMEIPLEDALRAATENPARALGIYGEHGTLAAGAIADVVLLNSSDLSIKQVILRGNAI